MKFTLKTLTSTFWNIYNFQQYFRKYSFKRIIHDNRHSSSNNESFHRNNVNKFYGFLTFFGLSSKSNTDKNKKGDAKHGSEWKREKDISRQISLAKGAMKEGDFKKAEVILRNALVEHEENQTVGITCVYEMLATIAYHEGRIEKSKEILEKVIRYLGKSGHGAESDMVVSFRLKLARILSKLGKSSEADAQFRQCLDIQKLKHKVGVKDEEEIKLRINCLFWYGRYLMENKKLVEAKQCFDTAYSLSAQVKTLENSQVMVILYNLSETLLATGDADTALRILLNAVILGRESKSPDLPLFYNRIGMIYLNKGVLREASHWCQSGIERAKRVHNKSAQLEGEDCISRINEFLKMGSLKI